MYICPIFEPLLRAPHPLARGLTDAVYLLAACSCVLADMEHACSLELELELDADAENTQAAEFEVWEAAPT